MAVKIKLDRMDDRLAALRAAIEAPGSPLGARVHSPNLEHFTNQAEADLLQGVVMSISAGESDYYAAPGMIALEGTLRVLLLGHCRVAETAAKSAIEALELDMIEEAKAFLRLPIEGMSLRLSSVEHSRQLEFPYGWFVMFVDLLPPISTTY